jgi:hypothetical protein
VEPQNISAAPAETLPLIGFAPLGQEPHVLLSVDGHFQEVTSMRAKKPSTLRNVSVLIELANHTAMGIAVGLAFAFILLKVDQYSVASFINHSASPEATKLELVGVVVATCAIGATLTGLVFMRTEESR